MIQVRKAIWLSFKNTTAWLQLLIFITITYQIFLHFCIPVLPHYLNDPAWYYMYCHYFITGQWIHEELYPSFREPVLYYSSMGYPVAHYLTYGFGKLFNILSITLLSHLQFILYLVSARMVFIITKKQSEQIAASIIALIYLWFIPFFNYAHLAMSETWFIAGFLFVIFLFDKSIQSRSKIYIAFTFLSAGYIFLVRPVGGVMLPILIVLYLFIASPKFKLKTILLCSLLFFCFPVCQSFLNKSAFNTWNLREGFGWNLWNRIVYTDGHSSDKLQATTELRKKINKPDFIPSNGPWWEVTSQLSHLGLQPHEIQDYCLKVDMELIKKHSVDYSINTLNMGLLKLPVDLQETEAIFSDIHDYKNYIIKYRSKHHTPLVNELEKQNFNSSPFRSAMLSSYHNWNHLYNLISKKAAYVLLNVLLWIGLIIQIMKCLKQQPISPTLLFFVLLPFAISIGSCAFEVLHDRYYLPGILLEIIVSGILISNGIQFLLKNKETR